MSQTRFQRTYFTIVPNQLTFIQNDTKLFSNVPMHSFKHQLVINLYKMF